MINPESRPAKAEKPENFGLKEIGKPVLTDRQLKILRLVALGLTNQEIADKLHCSPRTIKSHFYQRVASSGIFRRLGVCSRREAVVKAIEELTILEPLELVSKEESERCKSLTERQLEFLGQLANPNLPSLRETIIEISAKLQIKPSTVKNSLGTIYRKLGLPNTGKGTGKSTKATRAAVIYLAWQRRKEATSPSHETPHESSEAGG
ncbi:MAG TPA: LuxR C-terminal-related transcriptional regulator [Candidatus Bathyarchaeia archaeon]|nr:LuxR C-terminal-related transcriptional regulator [Candidatus Bathyarchaeia archaeon]